MNWSKARYIIPLVGVASLILSLGYVLGNRMYEIRSTPVAVSVTHWNKAELTPLASVKRVSLFGRSSEGEVKNVGTLLLYQNENSLDILVDFTSLPSTYNLAEKQITTPLTMQIYSAERSLDSNNYITSQIGTINVVQNDRVLVGKFPGSIKGTKKILSLERLLFVGPTGASELPPAVSLDFLPTNLKTQAAPYAWSDILSSGI